MKLVERDYNLELRLEEMLDPLRSNPNQVIQIDNHTSLRRTPGFEAE